MKRIFIALQWIVVAFLLVSLLYFVFRTDPPPDHNPADWSAWNGFYALAVEGVVDSDNPRYLSPAKLNEYLTALKDAGYNAITPGDVELFYYRDHPLPEKAVLLMFEGGRKDHIIRATPQLIQSKYIGTLFVPTSVTRKWGNHFVSQSNLRRISRSANWRLASMGHQAVELIKANDDGEKGRFLSSRLWNRHGRESEGAFQERVFHDYEKAASILQRAAGKPAAAYLYPYGDAGEGRFVDPLAESVNRGAVRQYHTLVFTQEGRPLNDYESDPLALSRLRLRGDWSGDQLVQMLSLWESNMRPVAGFEASTRWQFKGKTILKGNDVLLESGATAMLRGSGSWRDGRVDVSLGASAGSTALLYLRYAGPHSYLRVMLNRKQIRVQEKRAGKLQTLSRLQLNTDDAARHKLSLLLKDNRLWIEHNGVEFARAVPVSRRTKAGYLWLKAEGGSVTCMDLNVTPIAPNYLIGVEYHGLDAEQKKTATALMPFWYEADQLRQLSEQEQLDVMMAAQEGLETIPVITVGNRMNLEEARDLADRMSALLSALSIRMLIREFAIIGYQPEVQQAFHERELKVTYVVDVREAENELEKGIRLSRGERMLVRGNEARVLNVAEMYGGSQPPGRLVLEIGEHTNLPAGMERAMVVEAYP